MVTPSFTGECIGSNLHRNAFIHEQTTIGIHGEDLNWCTSFSGVSLCLHTEPVTGLHKKYDSLKILALIQNTFQCQSLIGSHFFPTSKTFSIVGKDCHWDQYCNFDRHWAMINGVLKKGCIASQILPVPNVYNKSYSLFFFGWCGWFMIFCDPLWHIAQLKDPFFLFKPFL